MARGTEHQNPALATDQSAARSAPPAGERTERTPQNYEYDAFVSYRRREATQLAQWIRNNLQRFRLPPEILRELPREKQELHSRRPQIWLDTSYEKSSDDFLLKKVFPALDKSARLIVVSTPAALENITGKDGKAQDNWLAREVDHFLGEARADETDRPVDVVFGPGAIEGHYPGRLSEKPRWDWIDLRSFNRWRVRTFTETLDDGLAKLVAGLYDVPDRFLPVLRREERRRRHRAIIGFGVGAFSVAALTTALAIWGLIQRADAVSALQNALVTRAQMSVRLATEELQKKDPDHALATALAGVETPSMVDTDRAVIRDSVTVVANSIASETFGGTLRDHSDAVLKVFLGPGGRSAITVGADDKAILWDGENGHPLRPIRSTILAGSVFAVAQKRGLIASGSPNGQVRFWNSSTPELSPRPFDFGETPVMLAFSDNDQLIAALGTTGRLAVWDVAKNGLLWAAPTPVPDASIIAFGPNCSCLAVGTLAGDLFAWSFDRMDPVLVRGASGRVTSGSFGRDGQFLFSTDDGRLWLTSAPLWPPPVNIGRHDGSITGFVVSPDGKLAATTSMDGIAWIWDLTKRIAWKRIKPVADTALSSVAFSPDGDSIALAYSDGTVAIWDIGDAGADASETLVMRGHGGTVLDLSFSPDGNWLASASLDRTARLWQLQTANRPRMLQAHQGAAFHAISRNGHYLISGGTTTDKKIQVWTGPIWERSKSIFLENQASALAISDDGKRAFIGTDRGDLLQWDTSGSVITPFSHDNGVVGSIAISPDGKTLAAIGVAGKLQVCGIVTSPPQCAAVSLGGWGYSVAFSEDGHWLGASSGIEGVSGLALVWDLYANKPKLLLKGHTERVSSIQFDRSGKRAVTVSWDGTARIWDLSTGKELVRLVEPKGHMCTAGFSPDGEWVATCSYDKTLRLWKVPKPTDPSRTVIMEAGNSILLSDTIALAQLEFGLGSNILAGSLVNGDIHLWHVPDGTLRVVLEGDGSPIRDLYFQPGGQQITAMTQNGHLLSWNVSPAWGLEDDLLLATARSLLPLPGSLAGKPEELTRKPEEPLTTRSATSQVCGFVHEHNLGLPPHNLSGAARARQHVSIPDSCNSDLTANDSKTLLEGLIAETEGDFVTALQRFTTASAKGEFSAEIGLGDLSFVDNLNTTDAADALGHYTRALERGVPHAASRLGWLLLADGTADKAAQAKKYFEESSRQGDADGFAGLAWVNERFGNSSQSLEVAFSNYIKAQYGYERDGDLAFAQEVGERRAMLARLIAPEQVADLFLSTRSSITSSDAINRQ
jgi:WD40 repeat protein